MQKGVGRFGEKQQEGVASISIFPRNGAMQKGYNQEKANMVVSRFHLLRAK